MRLRRRWLISSPAWRVGRPSTLVLRRLPVLVTGSWRAMWGVILRARRSSTKAATSNANRPAEQQVEVQLLHKLPLRADRVEGLQQQRPEQLLRRERPATRKAIQRLEIRPQRAKEMVHVPADNPKRMVPRNPILQAQVTEKTAAALIPTTHPTRHRSMEPQTHVRIKMPGVFQQPARRRPPCAHGRPSGARAAPCAGFCRPGSWAAARS